MHEFIGTATGKNYNLADVPITHSAWGLHYEAMLTFDKKAVKFAGLELINYTLPYS